jgi:hypothetical protein
MLAVKPEFAVMSAIFVPFAVPGSCVPVRVRFFCALSALQSLYDCESGKLNSRDVAGKNN